MSEEVYLYDLDWYHVHDNIGCVKGAFALKDSLSVEEYKELFKETYYILTTKKEIERLKEDNKELGRLYSRANNEFLRLHSIIKEVREYIKNYNIGMPYTHFVKKENLLEILDKENINEENK